VIVAHTIGLDDRVLIERVRMVNKTLSIFVVALQEGDVSEDDRLDIAAMLTAVADTIREEVSPQSNSESSPDGGPVRLQIVASQGSVDT
jgi:hypothetical protein